MTNQPGCMASHKPHLSMQRSNEMRKNGFHFACSLSLSGSPSLSSNICLKICQVLLEPSIFGWCQECGEAIGHFGMLSTQTHDRENDHPAISWAIIELGGSLLIKIEPSRSRLHKQVISRDLRHPLCIWNEGDDADPHGDECAISSFSENTCG